MKNKQPLIDSMPVLKYSIGENKLLLPLLLLGKMYHPKYGELEYTDKDYEDIKQNLLSNKLGFSPYVTHGHVQTDSNTEEAYVEQVKLQSMSTDAELKRGEITDVVKIDNVVYGIADKLHPNTKSLIESGEYEYASGEFIKNYVDKETGENIGTVLVRTSLTNAPFMPFKDRKLQLFSQNESENEESLQTVDSFVVKLQEDTELNSLISMPTQNETEVKTEDVQAAVETDTAATVAAEVETATKLETVSEETEKVETVAEPAVDSFEVEENVVTESVKESVIEETEKTVVPTVKEEEDSDLVNNVQEAVTEESAATIPPTNNEVNLIMDATKQMAEQFSSQIETLKSIYEEKFAALEETSSAVINNLKETVSDLQSKLTQQESIAQQFSTTLNNTAKQTRYQRLASNGVAPAVIEKFSVLESALEGASIQSKVLKFSTSEGAEEEKNLVQALEDLIVEASKSNVSVQKFGQASYEGDDLVSELKTIISRNRQLKK